MAKDEILVQKTKRGCENPVCQGRVKTGQIIKRGNKIFFVHESHGHNHETELEKVIGKGEHAYKAVSPYKGTSGHSAHDWNRKYFKVNSR